MPRNPPASAWPHRLPASNSRCRAPIARRRRKRSWAGRVNGTLPHRACPSVGTDQSRETRRGRATAATQDRRQCRRSCRPERSNTARSIPGSANAAATVASPRAIQVHECRHRGGRRKAGHPGGAPDWHAGRGRFASLPFSPSPFLPFLPFSPSPFLPFPFLPSSPSPLRSSGPPLQAAKRFPPQQQIEAHDCRQQDGQRLGARAADEPWIEHAAPRLPLAAACRKAKRLVHLLESARTPKPSAGWNR